MHALGVPPSPAPGPPQLANGHAAPASARRMYVGPLHSAWDKGCSTPAVYAACFASAPGAPGFQVVNLHKSLLGLRKALQCQLA